MKWTKRDDRWAILYYENETGKTDWTPAEVAKFLLDNNVVTPPSPPTPLEMLTRRLASAARKTVRDADDSMDRRLHVAYRAIVNGQMELRWVSLDGLGLTAEKFNDAMNLRQDLAVDILVRIEADIRHVKAAHPDWDIKPLDADLTADVMWRLPNEPGDEVSKVG